MVTVEGVRQAETEVFIPEFYKLRRFSSMYISLRTTWPAGYNCVREIYIYNIFIKLCARILSLTRSFVTLRSTTACIASCNYQKRFRRGDSLKRRQSLALRENLSWFCEGNGHSSVCNDAWRRSSSSHEVASGLHHLQHGADFFLTRIMYFQQTSALAHQPKVDLGVESAATAGW